MDKDSKDYLEAKKQIENIFNKKTDFREIVLWYDPAKDFEEAIHADNDFGDIKVLFYENNPFTIKETIECGSKFNDPTKKYLVYIPEEKPSPEEDWLEDIYLYSEVYYADRVALTMRNLGLTSQLLRNVINKHLNFFASQSRVTSLKKKGSITDSTTPEELELLMMSVLVKNAEYSKFDYILKEIIFDDSEQNKYNEILKYNLKDTFWDLVSEKMSYSGARDVSSLIDTLLLTHFSHNINFNLDSPSINIYVQKDDFQDSLIFVDSLLKTDKRYSDLESVVWNKYNIKEIIATKGLDQLGKCDTFKEIDEFIVDKSLESLANGSYDYDFYKKIAGENRLVSIWRDEYKTPYQLILDYVAFKNEISNSIDVDLDCEGFVREYAKNYYRIDNLYRHFLTSYERFDRDFEENENEIKLVEIVDNDYENLYLDKIGYAFSKSLKEKEPNFEFDSIKSSKNFFRSNLNRNIKKQFVIISDAMRYEVGVDLMNALNQEETFRGTAKIEPQVTTIPSITMFGMASLLPNRNIDFKNNKVYVDDKPSDGTKNRDKILSDYQAGFAAIQYSEIMGMNRNDLRAYMKDKSLVYIYHDTIDNAGEHDAGVLEACNQAIEEIIKLIKRLYNMLQISNYYITSDHGFIFRHKKIEPYNKYPSFGDLKPNNYSQRYAIVDDGIKYNDVNDFKMDYLGGCKGLRVIAPYGYDYFPMGGSGIQYIHGGTSLQELVTPVVKMAEMRSKAPDSSAEPVKVILKSTTRKIMTKSFSLTFEQVERIGDKKIPANLVLYFVDDNNEMISNQCSLIANKDTDNIDDRDFVLRFNLKDADYSRDKRYTLVIKNNDTGDIVSESNRFMIDIPKFKSFF